MNVVAMRYIALYIIIGFVLRQMNIPHWDLFMSAVIIISAFIHIYRTG